MVLKIRNFCFSSGNSGIGSSGLVQQLYQYSILIVLGCIQISLLSILICSFHLFSHGVVALSLASHLCSRKDEKVPSLLAVYVKGAKHYKKPSLYVSFARVMIFYDYKERWK